MSKTQLATKKSNENKHVIHETREVRENPLHAHTDSLPLFSIVS